MTNDPSESKARALFDAQVAATDGAMRTALRARRQAALESIHSRARPRWWMPASGFATAVLTVALILPRGASDSPEPVAADVELDAASGADAATLELEHDADFYTWLAEAPADFDEPAPSTTGPNDGWTP